MSWVKAELKKRAARSGRETESGACPGESKRGDTALLDDATPVVGANKRHEGMRAVGEARRLVEEAEAVDHAVAAARAHWAQSQAPWRGWPR